jgi:hypothetical protein
MACCDCCCPDGEECCKAPGENGICCDPERCCGTEEAPVCCPEGECCVDGECGPCEECEVDEDCPEGECCVDGECGPCCDYTPCECPDGRVPVQNGPAQGEPGFLGCCPPEYPFDFFGECCNGQDPNAEDFDCFGGIGPTQECPEGCICQEGLEAYIDAGMDPDYVGVSVCIPLDNPLP